MAQDEAVKTKGPTRLVIRNIGLLLSGELENPILDADSLWPSTERSWRSAKPGTLTPKERP